ncbi:MAG: helix-turn-helix domain-containing protein [Clostridia bacterium]|nr:helix-turn-helix domain-containing protein [Clostridia bacterium]
MSVYGTLEDLILSIEYGTGLHVSVWFFSPVESDFLALSYAHMIHASPFCEEAKRRPGGYTRCMRCKKWANEKALRTRRPFGGLCIHGIYEYCVPVEYDGQIVCVVYAGNSHPLPDQRATNPYFFVSNAQPDGETVFATPLECRRAAETVAGYLRLVLPLSKRKTDHAEYLVQRMKCYAKANYLYPVDLTQLAGMFHYNEKYIGRIFKKSVGMSFRQYLNSLRLTHAKELLLTTDDSVLQIALASGFNTVTYFNRIFREAEKCSPKDFRSCK